MKKIYKIVSFLIIVTVIFSLWINVTTAASSDYTIDDGERVPIPETYILKDVIYNIKNPGDEIKYYEAPTDLFINEQGYLFIADTGNHRIVKINKKGELIAVFKEANGKTFNSPQGVFADENGNLYIADTGNQRIVHLSATGEFVEEFVKPKSELLSEISVFNPTKIAVSPTGYIYVLKDENILIIDAYNNFRGYMGQTEIGYNLLDSILRIFASDEQKKVVRKRTAASYINMEIDEKGMIYAVTMDSATGEIKKLNSIGKNIYRKYTTLGQKLDLFKFDFITKRSLENKSFIFGERLDDKGVSMLPAFKDIAVDKNGIVNVIEGRNGKVYQYDGEGNLLTVFGGKSNQKGKFSTPEAIEVDDDGNIYVLDRVLGNIQIFEPSNFILNVHNAVSLYSNGEYDKAYDTWELILENHENYPLAHLGLAKAMLKKNNWDEAMNEYKVSNDRDGYSKAFVKYRYEKVREKFPVVILILLLSITVLILLLKQIKKWANDGIETFYKGVNKEKFSIIDHLKLALGVIISPRETFELLKNRRDNLNAIAGIIILILAFIVRLFYLFVIHFPLTELDVKNSNIFLEAVKLFLPLITWIIASFSVTAIMEGESKLKDIFISSSFCMVPYILINFFLAIFSNVLSRNELTLFSIIANTTWIWILILFLIQVKTLNDYRGGKTIAVSIMSVLGIGLIWAIGLMIYVFTGGIYQFITGIIIELKMILY